jgi:hypothetical protein
VPFWAKRRPIQLQVTENGVTANFDETARAWTAPAGRNGRTPHLYVAHRDRHSICAGFRFTTFRSPSANFIASPYFSNGFSSSGSR